jgi:uncharacterized protein
VPEHPNAEVVRRLFATFEGNDALALRKFFAEDATWRVGGENLVAGTHSGRREIVRFLAMLARLTGRTYSARLIDVMASDERAAAFYRATGERQGRQLDIDQVLLFSVRDGLIVDVVALPIHQNAFDVFWS